MWVYMKSEASLWTVGLYDPSGVWHPESDHGDSESAARRVAYLNGSLNADLLAACEQAEKELAAQLANRPRKSPHSLRQSLEAVRAAILKAKGG
jgi:hypothetical protein